MLCYKECSYSYEHHEFFPFHGQEYRVHSIVRLTDEGRKYLQSRTKKVILTEQFIWWNGKTCWKYMFNRWPNGTTNAITDRTPDEMIDSIVIEATLEHSSIQTLGAKSPYYKTGTKYSKKDWEIPEVIKGWALFIVVYILTEIFKDTYFKASIRGAALYFFLPYRQYYIKDNTFYIRDADIPILKEKQSILNLQNYNEEIYS